MMMANKILIHCRIPWFQYPIIYDIRTRPRKIASPSGTKDLQIVNIGLRVLSRPNAANLPQMYRQLGTDYDERVLPSICNEVSFSVRPIKLVLFLGSFGLLVAWYKGPRLIDAGRHDVHVSFGMVKGPLGYNMCSLRGPDEKLSAQSASFLT
jgi:hypothetical protein